MQQLICRTHRYKIGPPRRHMRHLRELLIRLLCANVDISTMLHSRTKETYHKNFSVISWSMILQDRCFAYQCSAYHIRKVTCAESSVQCSACLLLRQGVYCLLGASIPFTVFICAVSVLLCPSHCLSSKMGGHDLGQHQDAISA